MRPEAKISPRYRVGSRRLTLRRDYWMPAGCCLLKLEAGKKSGALLPSNLAWHPGISTQCRLSPLLYGISSPTVR